MSQACFVCGRKATRECPAGSMLEPGREPAGEAATRRICSQCCGKSRRRTIDCPDACPHFRAGGRAALIKLAELGGNPEMEIRQGEVLHNLRLAATRIRRTRLPDLRDGEARQAFANLSETMRTKSSGLIYEFRSADPRVQVMVDELLSVASLHERGEKGMTKTDVATLMQCLKYLEKQAAAAASQARGATLLLDLFAQTVTREFLLREPEGLVGGNTEP
ncbi:MAG TPA: hypothetical protein VMH22_01550 [bacterium]|nr:hypothetical protein [bacterium]